MADALADACFLFLLKPAGNAAGTVADFVNPVVNAGAQWCAISGACRGKRGYWLSFALTCSGDGIVLLFLFDRSIDDIHALLVG